MILEEQNYRKMFFPVTGWVACLMFFSPGLVIQIHKWCHRGYQWRWPVAIPCVRLPGKLRQEIGNWVERQSWKRMRNVDNNICRNHKCICRSLLPKTRPDTWPPKPRANEGQTKKTADWAKLCLIASIESGNWAGMQKLINTKHRHRWIERPMDRVGN